MALVLVVIGLAFVLGGFLVERSTVPPPRIINAAEVVARLGHTQFSAYRFSLSGTVEVALEIDDGHFKGKVTGKGATLPEALEEAFRLYDALRIQQP